MDDLTDCDLESNNESGASTDESDYEDIRPYFVPSEFKVFSKLMKTQYRNQKQRYEQCVKNGLTIVEPYFMRKTAQTLTASKRKLPAPDSDTGTRKSKRLTKLVEAAGNAPQSTAMQVQVDKDENVDVLYDSVKGYFDPSDWLKMSIVAKTHILNAMKKYQDDLCKGLSPQPPKFMKNKSSCPDVAASSSSEMCSSQSVTLPKKTNASSRIPFLSNAAENKSIFDGEEPVVGETLCDDFKKDIKSIVKAAVPSLSNTVVDQVTDLLFEKGVESLSDLQLVEAHWLEGLNLKELHIKKLMMQFTPKLSRKSDKENQLPKSVVSKAMKGPVPLMKLSDTGTTNAVIQSRPALAAELLPTSVLDYTIQWGKMRDSLLVSLEKQERPEPKDRENMVLVISKDIVELWKQKKRDNPTITARTPGVDVYRNLVRDIFTDYSKCFQDEIRGEIVGNGMFSLADQFETCIENLCRSGTTRKSGPLASQKLRSAACILPELYSPVMNKKDKNEAEQARYELLGIYRQNPNMRDWVLIKEKLLMPASLAAQRAMIVDKHRNLETIMERWPLLFEMTGMLCHLDAITKSSLLDNFTHFISNDLQDLVNYLTLMSEQKVENLKLLRSVATRNGNQYKLLASVMMLMTHFSENIETILVPVPDTTLPHEVLEVKQLPASPCIVPLDLKPFEANTYLIFLDGVCIGSVHNAAEAIMYLCATFFVFGNHYPAEASTTLTYIERIMANLSDGSGLVKASTPSGSASRRCLTKVTTLDQEVRALAKKLADKN